MNMLAIIPDDGDLVEIAWPDYTQFLESKIKLAGLDGIDVDPREVSPILKPHQRDIVVWALRGGRRAVFAAFGLGKTLIQIEIMRLLLKHVEGAGLIVLPLGVRQEFVRDAQLLGVAFRFIRRDAEIDPAHRFYLTNYESVRDGKLHPERFVAASLDEASCLRSYGSKTYQEFLPLFAAVPYRFVATATPAPNRYKEMIHYAGFLGIMDTGQALTRFFQRNSEQAGDLTLYPHKEDEFWLWVHSWAIFVQKPSDLGHSDEGYDLPPLAVHWHEVPSDHAAAAPNRDGQGEIFRSTAFGLAAAAREKRDSLSSRVSKMMEIVRGVQSIPACPQSGLLQATSREGEEAYTRKLSCEQAQPRSREAAALQYGISEDASAQAKVAGAAREREASTAGALRAGRGVSRETLQLREDLGEEQPGQEVRPEIEGYGPEPRGICRSTQATKRDVRDLRDSESDRSKIEALPRSLPYDREGEGDSLPSLQFRPGAIQGQSGASDQSRELPSQWVIWCDLNDEQRAIETALASEAISVSSLYGNQEIEERECLLQQWRSGATSVFLTKPIMYGAGVNLQQSHLMIFVGVGYKFADFVQGVHRVYRFMQEHPVDIHIIHSEAERDVVAVLKDKWARHDEMVTRMRAIIKQYGLDKLPTRDVLARSIGLKRVEVRGERFVLANNDCVDEAKRWGDNSIDEIVSSIPFGTQYEYAESYNDFGHNGDVPGDTSGFWSQMDFLSPQLLRMLKPGRRMCIHVKDRVLFGAVTGKGAPTVLPFHAEALMHYRAHGFDYMGMITIITDVVRENAQTYRLGWSENAKDSTKMGCGMPEYVLLFRKPQSDRSRGYADDRVAKEKPRYELVRDAVGEIVRDEDGEEIYRDTQPEVAAGEDAAAAARQRMIIGTGYSRARWQVDAHGFWRSSGDRLMTAEELAGYGPADLAKRFTQGSLQEIYDYEFHVRIGEELERMDRLPTKFMCIAPGSWHPDVWHDVLRMRTLNSNQAARKVEKHLCPLQFDIVDRLIDCYSNPGDLVFDPFAGLGTVPYRAILKGRRGAGSELNAGSFLDAVHYCRAAEEKLAVPTMFDLEGCGPLVEDDAAAPPPLGELTETQ